jgi:hypothetical protein
MPLILCDQSRHHVCLVASTRISASDPRRAPTHLCTPSHPGSGDHSLLARVHLSSHNIPRLQKVPAASTGPRSASEIPGTIVPTTQRATRRQCQYCLPSDQSRRYTMPSMLRRRKLRCQHLHFHNSRLLIRFRSPLSSPSQRTIRLRRPRSVVNCRSTRMGIIMPTFTDKKLNVPSTPILPPVAWYRRLIRRRASFPISGNGLDASQADMDWHHLVVTMWKRKLPMCPGPIALR